MNQRTKSTLANEEIVQHAGLAVDRFETSIKALLISAKVTDNDQADREGFEIDVYARSALAACESLTRLAANAEMTSFVSDDAMKNKASDALTTSLQSTMTTQRNKLARVRFEVAASLRQLEKAYFESDFDRSRAHVT